MSLRTTPTRSFLIKPPHPVAVRLRINGEKAPREIPVPPGVTWSTFADTIDALRPSVVEALDAEGTTLRARDVEKEEAAAAAAAEAAEADPDDDAPADDPTELQDGDSTIEVFARLLSDAHRQHSRQSFQFVETAFTRMVEVVQAYTRRVDQLERENTALRRTRAPIVVDDEPSDGANGLDWGLIMQMAQQFMAGAGAGGGGAAVPAKNGAANGHGKAKGGGT